MAFPEKEFHYLEEAAEKLGCKQNDLIHYGANGKLKISAKINLPYNKKMISSSSGLICCGYEGYFGIRAEDLRCLDENREAEDLAVNYIIPDIEDLAYWSDRLRKSFNTDDWARDCYFEDGKPVTVKRSQLVVLKSDLQSFETRLFDAPSSSPPKDNPGNLGGRAKEPLTEAMECLYKKFLDQGNTEVLREGKIKEFLNRLKEAATEGNQNADEYILERIAEVKITKFGHATIKTQDRQSMTRSRIITIESKTYQGKDVSKRLTVLRKKFPLPS